MSEAPSPVQILQEEITSAIAKFTNKTQVGIETIFINWSEDATLDGTKIVFEGIKIQFKDSI